MDGAEQPDRARKGRMTRRGWKHATVVLLLGLALVGGGVSTCLAILLLTGQVSQPQRWQIPAGYRGWVVIRFSDPTCPPLPTDGLTRVVVFDATGIVCTSSGAERGVYLFTAMVQQPDGTLVRLRNQLEAPPDAVIVRFRSFATRGQVECGLIGTEEDDRQIREPEVCNGIPQVFGP